MASNEPIFIPSNNWSANVQSAIGTAADGILDYLISKIGIWPTNPALTCVSPTFSASYKCGADTTAKNISNISNAWGKSVQFNCSNSFIKCSTLKLNLDDFGALTLTDNDGNQLWKKAGPTTDPNNPPLTLDEYASNSDNPAPNQYSQNSFLNSGDFLSVGQWIGSPTGKFRLEMISIPLASTASASTASASTASASTASASTRKELRVSYNVLGCSDQAPVNSNSFQLFSIPSINNQNVGKAGYIDELGKLRVYPNSMVSYKEDSDYNMVGNYGVIGGDLGSVSPVANVTACKALCSAYTGVGGLTEQCNGFVYESTSGSSDSSDSSDSSSGSSSGSGGGVCQLKGRNALTNGKRFINTNYEYYMRTGQVSPDISCPQTIDPATVSEWAGFATGSPMTPTTSCGLNRYTATERAEKLSAYNALNVNASSINTWATNLTNKFNTLKARLLNTATSLDASFNDLQSSKQEEGDWSGEQTAQLEAMNEDLDLNTTSQNYKYILWSILAIMVIIGIIILINSLSLSLSTTSIASTISNTSMPPPAVA